MGIFAAWQGVKGGKNQDDGSGQNCQPVRGILPPERPMSGAEMVCKFLA
jgi:hypothetical protein